MTKNFDINSNVLKIFLGNKNLIMLFVKKFNRHKMSPIYCKNINLLSKIFKEFYETKRYFKFF